MPPRKTSTSPATTINSTQPNNGPPKTNLTEHQRGLINEYAKAMLQIVAKYSDGIPFIELKDKLKETKLTDDAVIMECLNQLSGRGRVRHSKQGKTIIIHYVTKEQANKYKGLTDEQIAVFEVIESAGGRGIWKKNIARKIKKNEKDLEKILKQLETKQVIKKVNDISQKKGSQIVYIAANVEPSREITGGIWYIEGKFNSKLIDDLRTATCTYLEKKPRRTHEILEHIKTLGIIEHVDLKVEDMQQIVDTLVYDGFAQKVIEIGGSDKPLFQVATLQKLENAFVDIPCSTCPVFDQCTDNGDINPKSCIYLKEWMDF
ncbi:hypothetical protein ABK040_009811 [Willaertia magna]